MIYVIDDDLIMAECVAKACGNHEVKIFGDCITAMGAMDQQLPKLILMDMLPTGPDGFTFLNELASYPDTMQIPVVLMTETDLARQDLTAYGVVGVLNKTTMTPKEVANYVAAYC